MRQGQVCALIPGYVPGSVPAVLASHMARIGAMKSGFRCALAGLARLLARPPLPSQQCPCASQIWLQQGAGLRFHVRAAGVGPMLAASISPMWVFGWSCENQTLLFCV